MPMFNVKINGRTVQIHAMNEGQLSFAVAALKGALGTQQNKIEVQGDVSNENAQQASTINSASVGRPYIW